MAKLNGLSALFGSAQIRKALEAKSQEYDEKAIDVLRFTGEKFVNKARTLNTYKDRTGNLRSSIGYIIMLDGRVIDRNFVVSGRGSGGTKGTDQASKFASDVALGYPKGYVLIGVAGMNYAAYVEANGYDVITGASPSESEFLQLLNEIEF